MKSLAIVFVMMIHNLCNYIVHQYFVFYICGDILESTMLESNTDFNITHAKHNCNSSILFIVNNCNNDHFICSFCCATTHKTVNKIDK